MAEEGCEHDESDVFLCAGCGETYCDCCALYCGFHDSYAAKGAPLACPACDTLIPAGAFCNDEDGLPCAESSCSLCFCASVLDGTTWYCDTHRGFIPSRDAGGPYWAHEGCSVRRAPGQVREEAEGQHPSLIGTRGWALTLDL